MLSRRMASAPAASASVDLVERVALDVDVRAGHVARARRTASAMPSGRGGCP